MAVASGARRGTAGPGRGRRLVPAGAVGQRRPRAGLRGPRVHGAGRRRAAGGGCRAEWRDPGHRLDAGDIVVRAKVTAQAESDAAAHRTSWRACAWMPPPDKISADGTAGTAAGARAGRSATGWRCRRATSLPLKTINGGISIEGVDGHSSSRPSTAASSSPACRATSRAHEQRRRRRGSRRRDLAGRRARRRDQQRRRAAADSGTVLGAPRRRHGQRRHHTSTSRSRCRAASTARSPPTSAPADRDPRPHPQRRRQGDRRNNQDASLRT